MGITGELALTIYLNNDLDRDTVVYLEEVIVHGYELAITYPNLLDDEDFCDDGTRLIGVIRKF